MVPLSQWDCSSVQTPFEIFFFNIIKKKVKTQTKKVDTHITLSLNKLPHCGWMPAHHLHDIFLCIPELTLASKDPNS